MIKKIDETKIRNIIIICVISTLMGQFYISSVNTGFRLTLVVFFVSLFLFYFDSYNVILICMSVGISTFLFRSLIFYLRHSIDFVSVILQFIPVISYYFFFGLLFKVLKIREGINNPLITFFNLWAADSIPNIIEASIRKIWTRVDFSTVINQIILVALLRTTAILLIYYWIRHSLNNFQESERTKYYRESIMLISKLKTELFFLKKSRENIENLVTYTHQKYEESSQEKTKAPLLKIAKDIHEIKKDYLRVIEGMNLVFSSDANIKFMSNKDIFSIIKDNADKLIRNRNKNINFSIHYSEIFLTCEFYSVISILNNLIINSIDAINSYGEIILKNNIEENNVIFTINDTGEGIPENKLDVIFKSGYTTKYDPQTGKMSTGLGLSHVHNIVVEYFRGEIKIDSKIKRGTEFTIIIPKSTLVKKIKGVEN